MHEFKLDNQPKITPGFTVPDNYFADFSEKALLQFPKEEPKVISIWVENKKWLYAVAAVLVLSLSIPFIYIAQNNPNEVSNNEIENYLSYHSTLTDDDIVDLLDKEDIEKLNISSDLEDKDVEELLTGSSNLEQYITN
jgi:hypothetical protein